MRSRNHIVRRGLYAGLVLLAAGCATREASREAEDGAAGARERVRVSEAAPDTGSDPMIVALVQAFTARNAEARRVSIVEFRREAAGGGANLVLAQGTRPDASFTGPAEDDLFGVFVFDDSLKRIRRTVSIFPAPRPGETRMRFDRTSAESVYVFGWASTSGETLLTAGFSWRGSAAP